MPPPLEHVLSDVPDSLYVAIIGPYPAIPLRPIVPHVHPHGVNIQGEVVRFFSRPEEFSMIGAVIEGPHTGAYSGSM
jgi:hypothetical protein